MKKTLSLILALLLSASCMLTASAEVVKKAIPFSISASFTASAATAVIPGYNDKVYYTDYEFTAVKNGRFEFTMSSTAFDTVLLVLDSAGKLVAYNDDYNGSTNSNIFLEVANAGTYYLRATQITKRAGAYNLVAKVFPSGLSFGTTNTTMEKGSTQAIALSAVPSNAQLPSDISYKSSNEDVVSVSSTGVLTAKKAGTAVITASSRDLTVSVTITVIISVQSIVFTQNNVNLYPGRVAIYTPVFIPSDATYKTLTWSSSAEDVASVSLNGQIYGNKVGTSVITATAHNGTKASYTVNVIPLAPGMSNLVRLAGGNRQETAIAIADYGWSSASTVVLASGQNYADALCGLPVASYLNAPILLTNGGAALEVKVKEQINKLNPSKIIILGGDSTISEAIKAELAKGRTVERISGGNRYETSAEAAKYLAKALGVKPEGAVIAAGTNFADALSISPYAGTVNYPILYAHPTAKLSEGVSEYLKVGVSNIVIAGGGSSVSDDSVKELKGFGISESKILRLSGGNRYLTSLAIAKNFEALFENDISIATGTNFPDALAGGVLAAQKKVPLLLMASPAAAEPIISEMQSFMKARKPQNVYIFGGDQVVPSSVICKVLD
ncbi:MAG: cell wall-binding repeat-containing protein [Oscillospiraceae bacterium]|jgi:putative cell wall-binding protein|nr:cell wall-binding repeat-containing protein [Oscillospiraceae bacterium]